MIKFKELRKNNSMIIRIRNQMKPQNQRNVCMIYEWSLQYNELYYFYVIYIFDKTIIKTKILYIYHNASLIKNFEIKKTRSLLQKKLYWLEMLKNIKKYIQSCNIYKRVKIFCYLSYDETTLLFIRRDRSLFENNILYIYKIDIIGWRSRERIIW